MLAPPIADDLLSVPWKYTPLAVKGNAPLRVEILGPVPLQVGRAKGLERGSGANPAPAYSAGAGRPRGAATAGRATSRYPTPAVAITANTIGAAHTW